MDDFDDILKKSEEEKAEREKREAELRLELDSPDGGLSPKQERFCRIYASDQEFFGNGTKSYLEAYGWGDVGPKGYNSAHSSASRLLKNPKIYRRINELLELDGFNDAAVDKQLAHVIAQHADVPSKVAAIKEYNRVKSRVVERRKVEHDVSPEASAMAKAAIAAYLNKNNGNTADPGVGGQGAPPGAV